MKKLNALILALVLVAATPAVVFASDISDAQYLATVTVTNTSTVATNVLVPVTIDPAVYVANGYMDANFLNTCFQINATDIAYMPPHGAGTDWMFFIPSAGAGYSSAQMYMGGATNMLSKIRWFPGAGGMTVNDNPSLELSNNFQIDVKGRFDTSYAASKDIVAKTSAFNLFVNSAGNVRAVVPNATVYSNTAALTESLTALKAATTMLYMSFTPGAATAISSVSLYLGNATATGGNLYVDLKAVDVAIKPTGAALSTSPAVAVSTIPVGPSWISFDMSAFTFAAGTEYCLVLRTDGVVDAGTGIIWKSCNTGGYAGTGGYTLNSGVNWTNNSNWDLGFYVYNDAVVTAAVTSAEHTIRVKADATDLKLYVDNMAVAAATKALNGATVPNNANNWTFCENTVMPYVESVAVTVGGVAVSAWQWEADATFHDSVGSNDATPSFRTTTSDGDISAALTGFAPVAVSQATVSPLLESSGAISGNPGAIDRMYTGGDTGGLFGFDDLLRPALAAANIPELVFWYCVAFGAAIALGFVAYHFTRQFIVQAIVSGLIMALFAGGGVLGDGLLPYWPVVVFAIETIFLLALRERQIV